MSSSIYNFKNLDPTYHLFFEKNPNGSFSGKYSTKTNPEEKHLIGEISEQVLQEHQAQKEHPIFDGKKVVWISKKNIEDYQERISFLGGCPPKRREEIQKLEKELLIAKQSEEKYNEAVACNRLGNAYYRLGEYRKAISYHEKTLEISQQLEDRAGEGAAYCNLGNAYKALGEYRKAISYHEKDLEISQQLEDRAGEGKAYGNLGNAYKALGELKQAGAAYQSAIDCYARIQQNLGDHKEWKITIFEQQATPYLQLERVLIEQKESHSALEITESRRARSLVQTLEKRTFSTTKTKKGVFKKTLTYQGEVSKSPQPLLRSQTLSQSLDIGTQGPLSIEEMKEIARSQNITLLVYSTAPKDSSIHAWVLSPKGNLTSHSLKIPQELHIEPPKQTSSQGEQTKGGDLPESPEAQLIDLAESLIEGEVKGRYAARRQEKNQELELKRQAFTQKLKSLYEALIAPLEKHLPQDPNSPIAFIPDNQLASLPFGIFQDSKGKYLIEKHPLLIAPSIQTLSLLERRKTLCQTSTTATLVSRPNNPKVSTIKSSEKEEQALKDVLGSHQQIHSLTQEDAKKTNVLEKGATSRFLHIDCHGKGDLKKDTHSIYEGGLYLTGETEQDCLYAEDIGQTSFNTDIVFLSACHSGRGKLQQEGVIGLPYSFLGSGALSVVATYWELPANDLTIEMIKTFYHHILNPSEKNSPTNKAVALREAMLVGINKERDKPETWGALFLTGTA